MRRLLTIAVLGAFFGTAALAGSALRCFDRDAKVEPVAITELGLAAVTGTDKVPFAICTEPDCAHRGYLVAGDIVVTGIERNGQVCSLFPNRHGGTTGWLPKVRLKPLPVDQDLPLTAWGGKWQMEPETDIEIKPKRDRLAVEGYAVWHSNVVDTAHTGELDYQGIPVHGLLSLSDGDDEYSCKVAMRRLGPYLVVEDNTNCGGMNVTFTGAYRRPGAK